MERGGDERFAGPSWRIQNDILFFEQLENGGLLRVVQLKAARVDVIEEPLQQEITVQLIVRDEFIQR